MLRIIFCSIFFIYEVVIFVHLFQLPTQGSQVKNEEMPLAAYTLVHRKAILSKEDKQFLKGWFNHKETVHIMVMPNTIASIA